MRIIKTTLFFSAFLTLDVHAAIDLPATHHFDDAGIAAVRHFTKHSYIVAQQFHEWRREGDRLEGEVNVGGERLHSFSGRTGFMAFPREQAIGAIYRGGNTIYVSYHGSHFVSDWITDFKAWATPADPHGFGGRLHYGFSETVQSSYDSMLRQIRATIGDTPLRELDFIFCGHSLGGGLATIAARQFSALNGGALPVGGGAPVNTLLPPDFDRNRIKLVSFSSPPVGDREFAVEYRRQVPVALRFHHGGDVVPGIEKLIFNHIGYPIETLFLEPSASLLTTSPGLHTLRETFGTVTQQNFVGASVHVAADVVLATTRNVPRAAVIGYAVKGGAYLIDGVSRLVPPIIKLMHLIPEEDVILKAFGVEKARAGDDDYKGPSWSDYTRNPFMIWFYRHFI
jgi:pimeloyl-ACP methyl ester carboxylesterase